MGAKLQVQLLRARNLAAKDANGLSDPFARLQLNKQKARSGTVYKNLNPAWNEEFQFKVDDAQEDVLHVSLWDEDLFGKADFLGQLAIPLANVADFPEQRVPPTWFALQKKSESSSSAVSGEILVALALWGAASATSLSAPSPLQALFTPSTPLFLTASQGPTGDVLPSPPESFASAASTVSGDAEASALDAADGRTRPGTRPSTAGWKKGLRYFSGELKGGSRSTANANQHQQQQQVAGAGDEQVETASGSLAWGPTQETGSQDLQRSGSANAPAGAEPPASESPGQPLSPKNMSPESVSVLAAAAAAVPHGSVPRTSTTVHLLTSIASLAGPKGAGSKRQLHQRTTSAQAGVLSSAPPGPSSSSAAAPLSSSSSSNLPSAASAPLPGTAGGLPPKGSSSSPPNPAASTIPQSASKSQHSIPRSSSASIASAGAGAEAAAGTATAAAAVGGEADSQGVAVGREWFERDLTTDSTAASSKELPPALTGGVVLDQMFECPAHELNKVVFAPDSDFFADFTSDRKVTQLDVGPWLQPPPDSSGMGSGGGGTGDGGDGLSPGKAIVRRQMTYMTAPSALVKSVKATEEMVYTRADSMGYVVDVVVATPDVPYGNTFRTLMQFAVIAHKDGKSSLRVSWQAHFLQSTMMKGMIENGMRTGIKETYVVFLQILCKYVKPATEGKGTSDAAAAGAAPPELTVLQRTAWLMNPASAALFALGLVLLPWHIALVAMSTRRGGPPQGLRLWVADLPDSLGELATTALFVLAAERCLIRLKYLVHSRLLRKSDAGKRAEGEGWLVTISLLDGQNIGEVGLQGLSDPYVVFTCNGKTRTSSVKLQTANPKWNEVLEFDAFEDAPSTMDVEVLDYEGPFSEAELLGRAEVNFVKQSSGELADLWLDLEGRRACVQGSRLHLRIALTQTSKGAAPVMPRIIDKISKEIGTKPHLSSAEKSVSFQKLFDLPEHEFLINNFSCAIKKNLITQGRLFVSPRLLGFYSNLFGRRLKVVLLWEDIDEMRQNAPSIHTINRLLNPSVTIYVKKGRAHADARSAAYGIDPDGRLKVRFQSFVRFGIAWRTMDLLWRNRALPPEQQLKKVQEAEARAQLMPRSGSGVGSDMEAEEDDGSVFVGTEAAEVIASLSHELPISVSQFLGLMQQVKLMEAVAEANGQLNLEATEWVPVEGSNLNTSTGMNNSTTNSTSNANASLTAKHQRTLKYLYSRQKSPFGTAVTVVQQVSRDANEKLQQWASMEELITLHDVPFGDHFQVEMKRDIRASAATPSKSEMKITVSVAWQKETSEKTKSKIKADISAFYKRQTKTMMDVVLREVFRAPHL